MSVAGAIRSLFVEVGLVDDATAPLEKINKEADKTKETLGGVSKEAQKAADSQRNVFLGIGAAMGVGGAFGLSYFKTGTEDLAKYQDAYAAFKTNVKGNTAELVASLQAASAGLIDEGDMLAQANKALLMGVPEDKLATLMRTSRALARQTGEDLPTIWTSLTSGAARASPKMLEAVGIQMSAVTEAEKAWAKARGISAAALTEEQKNQIFMNYIMEHSNEILKKTDFTQESLNETLVKSNRSWAELRQEVVEGALPIIVSVVKVTNLFIDGLRALPGPAKGAIGIVGVLATGMALLGSFALLNAAAFMMLKKELIEVSTTGTMWGGVQAVLIGETGLLTGAVSLLTGAYTALAASELAVLWPLIPLVGILYLLWDLHTKGWKDSMLGRTIQWLGDTVPGVSAGFEWLTGAVKGLWEWITKIPTAISEAWSTVTNHPLFKVASVMFAFTPMGMAINSARLVSAAAPVVMPSAERLIASSSSSRSIRTGDVHYTSKTNVYAQKVDEAQMDEISTRSAKKASKYVQDENNRQIRSILG